MKKTSQIVLFLFLILLGCNKKTNLDKGRVSEEDSLSTYLSLANDINLPYDLKQKYTQKAYDIVIDKNNDSMNRVNLFRIANRYYNMNDLKSYRKITKLVLERSISAKDSVSIGKAYTYLGDFYSSQSIADSAFLNFFKAQKIYLRINDSYNLAQTFLSKASLQYNEGDFFESEIAVFKALSILKKQKKSK